MKILIQTRWSNSWARNKISLCSLYTFPHNPLLSGTCVVSACIYIQYIYKYVYICMYISNYVSILYIFLHCWPYSELRIRIFRVSRICSLIPWPLLHASNRIYTCVLIFHSVCEWKMFFTTFSFNCGGVF